MAAYHCPFLRLCTSAIYSIDDVPLLMLVFPSGFPEFWYTWRHQLKAFAEDYDAVAIDMRGYGDSSKPR
eukprot:82242-Pelagomonas_calceolata.AAC.1